MSEEFIGRRRFTDGEVRIVYEDEAGKQFVLEDDGEVVHGVWILREAELEDEPIVVGGSGPRICRER